MRFMRVAPYETMVKTCELHMFECPNCKRTEQRLVLTHPIRPLPSEQMQLPSIASPRLKFAMHRITVAARNGWTRTVGTFPDSVLSVSVLLSSFQNKVSIAVREA